MISPKSALLRLAMIGLVAVGLGACDDEDPVIVQPDLAIDIAPDTTLFPGDTARLRVVSVTPDTLVPVWTTSNAAVAVVDSTGLVTAVAPGTAFIIATVTLGGQTASDSVTITVVAAPAPTIAFAEGSIADSAVFNDVAALDSFLVEFSGGAGFGPNPVEIRVQAIDTIAGNDACPIEDDDTGDTIEECDFVAGFDASLSIAEIFDDDGDALAQPTAGAYLVFTARVRDLNGVLSNEISRTILVDPTAPIVVSVTGDETPEGGSAEEYTVTATDNLDLRTLRTDVKYETFKHKISGRRIITAGDTVVGSFGFDVLTTEASATQVYDPFIISIEETDSDKQPTGKVFEADAVRGHATDVAGNEASPFKLDLWVDEQDSFDNNKQGEEVKKLFVKETTSTSVTVVTRIDKHPSGWATNPFVTVRLYRVTDDGLVFVAEDTSADNHDQNDYKDFTWVIEAGEDLSGHTYVVLAVAADGRALASQDFTI